MLNPSASEVTTIWRYTNVYIIIINLVLDRVQTKLKIAMHGY